MSNKQALAVCNMVKDYPGVRALNNVSMEFTTGEVHAIIGENGAGKSTLIKCLSGAIVPNGGEILLDGKSYSAMTPNLAKKHGIEVIYQETNLVPAISAAENVFLCQKTGNGMLVNVKERERMAAELFRQLKVEIDPARPVRELSPACRQIVEIAKAVSRNVKVLVMDEPTAPLTVSEVEMLFKVVRDLRDRGVTILYISHRLEELFEIADRVTIMRDGAYIDTKNIENTNRQELISLMAGRDLTESYPKRKVAIGEEVLRAEDLSGNGVEHVSFSLRRGEILGFAGLVGAGRTELMQVLYGMVPICGGELYLKGTKVNRWSPRQAIESGLGLIPEDRMHQGVFLNRSIRWNTVINAIKNVSRYGLVDENKEKKLAEKYRSRFDIKTPTIDKVVGQLSGGNQQKVVIAKTMAAEADIIIFDEPTRGIDVGAKQEIYKLMNELAEAGHALLMVSSDMPELLGMSDRIVVVAEGRQAGTLTRDEFDQTRILDLASGGGTQIDPPLTRLGF